VTVANILLEKDRVRLVSDTVGYRGKEPAALERKVTLHHGPGVAMIVRGLRALALNLEPIADGCTSFEEVISAMRESITDSELAEYVPGSGAEVTVLGMVNGVARCSRLLLTVKDGAVTVQRIDLAPGVYLAPTLGQHSLPLDMTDEQAFKVALLQQEIAIKHGLNICIGGDVELATVDASGLSVRKIGEYPNKAMTVARIAALDASDINDVAA
jgi:hypothetical protein